MPLHSRKSPGDLRLAHGTHTAARPPDRRLADAAEALLNASTSTFYRHALDRPNDEFTGELGDRPHERGTRESATLPETWSFSIDVAARWEEALAAIPTPQTRKIRLRSSMVMSPDEGGVFSVMSKLARLGLGGSQGSGKQFVSWIHGEDLCRAVDLLLEHPEITDETEGVVNLSAPGPLPNRDFFRTLRRAWGQPIGCPLQCPRSHSEPFLCRPKPNLC